MEEIDWVQRWGEMVEAREDQAARLRARAALPQENFWDQRAEGFRRATQRRSGEPDRVLELVSAQVTPQTTVLDVGAGVGRYALPLAAQARRVVAVEPSEGMRGYLEADLKQQGLANVEVVAARWEEVVVAPADVVLCSHVVYTVTDIRGFLEKLQAHTKGHCFMVIRTRERDAHLRDLWREVHGEELSAEPGFMPLYNAVRQCLGVVANAEAIPFRTGRAPLAAFESVEEAVASIRGQLYVREGTPQERVVREYVRARLVEREDRLVLPGPSIGAAVLWWDNRPGSWNVL